MGALNLPNVNQTFNKPFQEAELLFAVRALRREAASAASTAASWPPGALMEFWVQGFRDLGDWGLGV